MATRIRSNWRCTYASKLNNCLVGQTVNRNQRLFEQHGEAVDEVLEYIQNNPQCLLYRERFNAFVEQENSEVREELLDHMSDNDSELCEDEINPGSDTPEITKKRSHTQLDSRKQVIAFQDRVITINIKEAQHPLKREKQVIDKSSIMLKISTKSMHRVLV